eukprot:TRINITY_DN51260_c0_g1_i1.p1 TRINITY_DN51260_c0_g1~~TRINITY_DN51260_c0_g1_i1.p1  ORF type:complete len:132 (+),score=45.49 TRINITY_DN51260_c0_g1_i1:121-516(+)
MCIRDSTTQVSARELVGLLRKKAEARDSFRSLFHEIDGDGTGTLDRDEVKNVMARMNLSLTDPGELDALFKFCDLGHDSIEDDKIDFNEFQQRILNASEAVSYTHLRAHETPEHIVCRLLLEKKKKKKKIK